MKILNLNIRQDKRIHDKIWNSYLTFQASLQRAMFVSESTAVVCFTNVNSKEDKLLDLHLIDIISMTENPVQDQMFKDCYKILKVNYGKGN